MVLGGSETKWVAMRLFRASVLTALMFMYVMVYLVHSLRTGTGTGSSTVQPLQIGRSSAGGENQIEGVTSAVGSTFNMQREIETVQQ